MQPNLFAGFEDLFLSGSFDWDWNGYYAGQLRAASGRVCTTNPAYTLNDLLAVFPKFFGAPLTLTGNLQFGLFENPFGAAGFGQGGWGGGLITSLSISPATSGVKAGQLITAPDIPFNTTILGLVTDPITNQPALGVSNTLAVAGVETLNIYIAPFIPLSVLSMYILIASASLLQARYNEMWPMAMGLYVAHFATLWLRSEGNIATTAGQAAATGLAFGIQVSKSVGDVSTSTQLLEGLEGWGAFGQTTYGQQLITFGQTVGMGPVWVP